MSSVTNAQRSSKQSWRMRGNKLNTPALTALDTFLSRLAPKTGAEKGRRGKARRRQPTKDMTEFQRICNFVFNVMQAAVGSFLIVAYLTGAFDFNAVIGGLILLAIGYVQLEVHKIRCTLAAKK